MDGFQHNFFAVLGNNVDNSYHYFQIGLPGGSGFPSYLLDVKKDDKQVRGGFYHDYENLAVLMESDIQKKALSDESYKSYFEEDNKYVTPSLETYDPGKYNFDAILLKSDKSNWIKNERCVIHMSWPFVIEDDASITVGSPVVDVGKLVDVTDEFSPLKQGKAGVNSDVIKCKPGLRLILQIVDDSGNKRPACVTPETKEKLIERGWTEHLQINVHRMPGEVYIGSTDIPSANNQFALRFYSQLSEDDREGNIFFSPSSIFTAFAIAYEGAGGNTATEMQQVFGFEKDDSKRKAGFAEMQKLLNPQDEEYVLNIANALWLAKGFEVNPEYSKTVKTHYDSNVESVDFTSEKDGLDIINQWVDEKTNGKIEKIFEELDPQTKLAITNAIHFKGDWAEPFDKEKTTNSSFYINEKTSIQVPMMELKTTYLNAARQDNVQILELPYEGEKLSMLVLLPNEVDGIKSLEESLSKDNLDEWKSHLQQSKVKVHMPKFKLETHYDMVPKLQDMGIYDAFGNADFSGISNSGLYIYKAIHKAFVDVNEEGTEAAAATGMAMRESGPMPFTANHPFVFLIQDNDTGQILFMGRVMDPTK